jgi:hypothetical protein
LFHRTVTNPLRERSGALEIRHLAFAASKQIHSSYTHVTLLRKPHPTGAVQNVENPGAAKVYDLTTANYSDNSTEAHVQTLNQTLTRPRMEPSDC